MPKSLDFTHSYVLIFLFIMIAAFLTWFIPAGHFERVYDINGKEILLVSSFSFVKNTPVGFFQIPLKIVQALNHSSELIFLVLIVGGSFNIIIKTGSLKAIIIKYSKFLKQKELFFIPCITAIFALSCMSLGVNTFIGFAPFAIIMARLLGYDALIGISIIMLGGAVGFASGVFNPFSTAPAQEIAKLPLYSGAGYRFFSLVVFWLITNIYLIHYARQIRLDPEKSLLYSPQFHRPDGFCSLDKRHFIVLFIVVAFFILLVLGGALWHWGLEHCCAVFLWMGILAGLAFGFKPSFIASEFIKGAKALVFGALLIGVARSISLILEDGNILESLVYFSTKALELLPPFLQSLGMLFEQFFLNIFVISAKEQSLISTPSMLAISDLASINPQLVVLCLNFGDGLGNYMLPTSSALMGYLAIANISYDIWIKFFWKLFLLWVLAACVLVLGYHIF